MYHITLAPTAKKELKKLKKMYRESLAEAIDELREEPFIGKLLTRDLEKRFSCRIGVYRIIYKINEKDKHVFIFTIDHRSYVYEK